MSHRHGKKSIAAIAKETLPFQKQNDRLMQPEKAGNFVLSKDELRAIEGKLRDKSSHPLLAQELLQSKEKLAYYLKIMQGNLASNSFNYEFSDAAQVLALAHNMGADLAGILPAVEKMMPEKIASGIEHSPFCSCLYFIGDLCATENQQAKPSQKEAFALLVALFDSHSRPSVEGDLSAANQISGTMRFAMSKNNGLALSFCSSNERMDGLFNLFLGMDRGEPAYEGALNLLSASHQHGADLERFLPALAGMLGQTADFDRFKRAESLLFAFLANSNEGKPGKGAIWGVIAPIFETLKSESRFGSCEARNTKELRYYLSLLGELVQARRGKAKFNMPNGIFQTVCDRIEDLESIGLGM